MKRREMKKDENQSLFIVRKRGDSIYISLQAISAFSSQVTVFKPIGIRGILSVHRPCVVGFSLDNLFENGLVPRFCRFDIGILYSHI